MNFLYFGKALFILDEQVTIFRSLDIDGGFMKGSNIYRKAAIDWLVFNSFSPSFLSKYFHKQFLKIAYF